MKAYLLTFIWAHEIFEAKTPIGVQRIEVDFLALVLNDNTAFSFFQKKMKILNDLICRKFNLEESQKNLNNRYSINGRGTNNTIKPFVYQLHPGLELMASVNKCQVYERAVMNNWPLLEQQLWFKRGDVLFSLVTFIFCCTYKSKHFIIELIIVTGCS